MVVGLLLAGPANHAAAQGATAPGLTAASAQGNLVYADYDQALDESHTPPPNAYVIRINGKRTTVQNVSVSGQRVTLTLQAATIDGDTVLLTYRHRAKPTLRSVSGVNATTVRNVAVEVLSFEAVVETFEPEQPEAASQVSGQVATVCSSDCLDAPTIGVSRGAANDTLLVGWRHIAGATGYEIQYSTTQGDFSSATLVEVTVPDPAPRGFSQTISGLTTNTRYYFRAASVNANGRGDWSTAEVRLHPVNVVTIAPNSNSITEGEDAVFTVTLSSAPSSATTVTVNVRTVSGDYGITQGSNHNVTVGTGGTGTLTLSTTDDSEVEDDGRITVRVHPAPTGWAKGTPNEVSMTIRDNDGTTQPTTNDYDSDNDGLIEIDSLSRLNAIRYDLDGNGVADNTANNAAYATAFPDPAANQCDDSDTTDVETCTGYELTANLDFDENGDGNITSADATYWNSGAGWDPIGDRPRFTTTFEGNNNTISNLFINRSSADRLGLFARIEDATVRNLVLTGAEVTGDDNLGVLAGRSYGTTSISGVSATGNVTGDQKLGVLIGVTSDDTTIGGAFSSGSATGSKSVGGLVGSSPGSISRSRSSANVFGDQNGSTHATELGGLVGSHSGSISESYATGSVSPLAADDAVDHAGGLVGYNSSGSIIASYATGSVSIGTSADSSDAGGLVGNNSSSNITASYSTGAVSGSGSNVGGLVGADDNTGTVTASYWDTESSGQSSSAVGTGKTGDDLRSPTGYTGIYANWNVDLDNADGDNSHATGQDDPWDFGAAYNYPTLSNAGGNQQGPGPVQNLTVEEVGGQAQVTWDAPSGTDGTITYELRSLDDDSDSASWSNWVVVTSPHTLPLPAAGQTLRVEVRAVGTAAHSRSQASSGSVDGPAVQTDYDDDNDGLIDVDSLAKLNAIRYDLDGSGEADIAANDAAYAAAFPNPVSDQCDNPVSTATETCTGYELAASLDFDTNGNSSADSGDTYWNGGGGWLPIAGAQNIGANEGFQATFEGNGHTISNLFINRDWTNTDIWWAGYRIGLFGTVSDMAIIRNLTLTDVDVTGDEEVGGLAGSSLGAIEMVDVTGDVTGSTIEVGGLVGSLLRGSLIDSTFNGTVSGTASHMGGLVGASAGATIRDSEAAGTVRASGSSSGHVGGLAGRNTGTIAASYSTSTVNANGAYWVGGLVGTNGSPDTKGSGRIIACYADNAVHGKGDVGGLVGENYASISTSYSTGAVHKHGGPYAGPVGGLVGRNELNNNDSTVYYSVTNSYWNGSTTIWIFGIGSDNGDSDNAVDSGETNTLPGHTTTQLQAPTDYNGIYSAWNVDVDGDNTMDDPWLFGRSDEYPGLR